MTLKNYQQKALEKLQLYFDELKKTRAEIEGARRILKRRGAPRLPPSAENYPLAAWEALKKKNLIPPVFEGGQRIFPEYVRRTGANGAPIPHVCLKIPTGGGKTLLGAEALRCLKQDTGFVLWIVPTKAIYEQTVQAFRTREHPCRQILENISGGKLKLLEKNDRWIRHDLENHFCLMTLMLPSANRQKNKNFLKIFRDSGSYASFFPEADDDLANRQLLEQYPDLEKSESGGWARQSLINVLKRIRPTVILDEAHKAYGKNDESGREFVKSVNQLNPRFVLELSATPKAGASNILVNVPGMELKAEEMIKLPLEIHSFINSDWKHTLAETQKKLNELEKDARRLYMKTSRYIRPMALVRAEQTGKAQIGRGRIHAEDVKKYLIRSLSVPAGQIRIQSSEKKELAGEDLMGEASQIRWIITKDALKEGWDCSFAYILALLDSARANTAITQMAGRVMRQPQAQQVSGMEALNRCYIYCFNKKVREAVQKVRESLEREGLTGLDHFVHGYSGAESGAKAIALRRRKKYQKSRIFLPQVLHKKGKSWQPIDYDRHVLAELKWESVTAGAAVNLDDKDTVQEIKAAVDLQGKETVTAEAIDRGGSLTLDYFARRLEDVIPNPWQAARAAESFIKKHQKRGHDSSRLPGSRVYLSEVLKKRIKKDIDMKAEAVFRAKVRKDEIRFRLETDERLNYEMERSFQVTLPRKSRTLQGELGSEMQYSLFEPVFESAFDSEIEKNAAICLDKSNAIHWWHRIAARQDYFLQGWRRHRVYPDFLAYRQDSRRLFIIELKGGQFRGSSDTEYKKNLFERLERAYKSSHDRGEMRAGSPSAVLRMMFEDSWEEDLKILAEP